MNIDPVFPTKHRVTRNKNKIMERIMRNMKISRQKNHLESNIFLLLLIWKLLLFEKLIWGTQDIWKYLWILYDSEKLKSFYDNELNECLTDVAVEDLYSELKVLLFTLPTEIMFTMKILEFEKLEYCYLNIAISYGVLLTVLVTVASIERIFSKLKLIKTYLRSSMT